ncbi:hypothetical protein [Halosegnis marinus]|uniref:Uncharacterized protein n=1 Tax=Halosegnis marinus TaxID=3034023 RepID=A0ABD5ZMX5_9EURY|nr:hypothetical protein [Halosegnis sp. DT85]
MTTPVLQGSLPSNVVALTLVLLPAGLLAAAVWVYDDARDRDRDSDRPALWAVASAAVPFVLPVYLVLVAAGRAGARASPPGDRERTVGTFGFGSLLAFVAGSALAPPPDPVTQFLFVAAALPPSLVVAYVLVGRVGPDPPVS